MRIFVEFAERFNWNLCIESTLKASHRTGIILFKHNEWSSLGLYPNTKGGYYWQAVSTNLYRLNIDQDFEYLIVVLLMFTVIVVLE